MFNPFRRNKLSVTVGIQLSANCISILVLDAKDVENPVIKDYVNYVIDSNTSSEQLSLRIKQYIEESNLKNANCCLVLDDQDYQLLVVDPPNVPEPEMVEAVKWKIKDLIQFPVAEAVVDVFLQPDSLSSAKNIANVIVAHKDVIDKKTDFIKTLGLNLLAVEIPEFSYRNYFENTDYDEKSIALVLVKEGSGKLIVLQKGNVYFSRSFTIPYKGGLFDDVPESEVVLELQRSLDYYERQLKQAIPATVIFAGENLVEDKITDITKQNLNQDVVVETIKGFQFSEEDALSTSRTMAVYGASLRRNLLSGKCA